jgi:hypothetical protein
MAGFLSLVTIVAGYQLKRKKCSADCGTPLGAAGAKALVFIAAYLDRLKARPDTKRLRISGAEARVKYDGIVRGLKPPPPSGPILLSPAV